MDREPPAREEFVRSVRETMDAALATSDHHPHGGYTPAAFRHYIRELALLDALSKLEFRSALDVGCAEGYFMNVVRERFGADVWGVPRSRRYRLLRDAHTVRLKPLSARGAGRLRGRVLDRRAATRA